MRYLIHVMYQSKHRVQVNKGRVVALQYSLVSDVVSLLLSCGTM